MAHQRKLIRHYIRDMLANGATVAGTRVVATRKVPVRTNELPCISVYTLEDDVDEEQSKTAPREYTRDLTAQIACWVPGGDQVDDAMDDLAEQIETLMAADRWLGTIVPDVALAADTTLVGTKMDPDPRGDATVGIMTITYRVTFRTLAPAAPTLTDEFLTADVTYPIAGSTPDTPVSEDQITVRTP